MPLIEITLGEGRDHEQIRSMIHEVHEAVLRTANTRPEHIRVIVREVPRTHWATGDRTLREMDAAASPPRTPSGTEEQS
ncbi:tautomerase family protein [Nocardioides pyridinolyticus]